MPHALPLATAHTTPRTSLGHSEALWGDLTLPGSNDNPAKSPEGLRIAGFLSFDCGLRCLEALKDYETRFPTALNIVGVATDNPLHPNAKLSVKKRLWQFYDKAEWKRLVDNVKESALSFGVPCYTGAVKTDYFRALLQVWKPDAIVMFAFGQILDAPVFDYPQYGTYNFHPSDLENQLGAGPNPHASLMATGADTTKLTVHRVDESIDGGPVVGASAAIYVKLPNGTYPSILTMHARVTSPVGYMTTLLVQELVERRRRGQGGGVQRLHFAEKFPDQLKQELLLPIHE